MSERQEQISLFPPETPPDPPERATYGNRIEQRPMYQGRTESPYMEGIYLDHLLPLAEYDKIIILFSGGKDSLACALDLLERGVPREKSELWHHDIDGGNLTRRMDWPVTQEYVQAVSEYLGMTLRVSWRVNGFWGEVYRIGASWPIQYVEPDTGEVKECRLSERQIRTAQLRKKNLNKAEREELESMGHRMKFPAKSGSLSTRWCSSILKIEVAEAAIRNIEKLAKDVKILIISGERRQESAGRAKYNEMEIHRTNATQKANRLVHQWRSVIDWPEEKVWEIIKRHHIAPHPCYSAGWNRCSCMMCIFSLPSHWAGIRELFPERFAEVEEDERTLGFTLDNKKTLAEYTGEAESCVCHDDPKAIYQLQSGEFSVEDVEKQVWTMPAGAFHGAKGGPC